VATEEKRESPEPLSRYWRQSGVEFRVLFVMPTKARVAHFLSMIDERFPPRRFWFTDEESYRANVLGKIWWTPRDFRDESSLLYSAAIVRFKVFMIAFGSVASFSNCSAQ
jgi:hypothetical protein